MPNGLTTKTSQNVKSSRPMANIYVDPFISSTLVSLEESLTLLVSDCLVINACVPGSGPADPVWVFEISFLLSSQCN